MLESARPLGSVEKVFTNGWVIAFNPDVLNELSSQARFSNAS